MIFPNKPVAESDGDRIDWMNKITGVIVSLLNQTHFNRDQLGSALDTVGEECAASQVDNTGSILDNMDINPEDLSCLFKSLRERERERERRRGQKRGEEAVTATTIHGGDGGCSGQIWSQRNYQQRMVVVVAVDGGLPRSHEAAAGTRILISFQANRYAIVIDVGFGDRWLVVLRNCNLRHICFMVQ